MREITETLQNLKTLSKEQLSRFDLGHDLLLRHETAKAISEVVAEMVNEMDAPSEAEGEMTFKFSWNPERLSSFFTHKAMKQFDVKNLSLQYPRVEVMVVNGKTKWHVTK